MDQQGYKMMSYVTKKLHGNIIPITTFLQENWFVPLSRWNPTVLPDESATLKEINMIEKSYNFSFKNIVTTFLEGKEVVQRNMNDSPLMVRNDTPGDDIYGCLCYRGRFVM